MNEELERLRASVQSVKVGTSFLKDGFTRLDERVGAMADDLDAFIDVYVKNYTKLEERVTRLENSQ